MYIVRRGLLVIITPFFAFLLFATAFDWGIVKTVGHPASVKQIVSESGIYDSLIPSLLTKVGQVDTSVGKLAANDPAVAAAAKQAFSPKYVQQNTETVIDSIYGWLDGKVTQPNFRVDLSGAKANFAESVASQFKQKAAALPKCTTPYTTTSFDISTATCLPSGITAASIGQSIQSDVGGGKAFIENSVISAASIKDKDSNQSIFQGQLKSLPKNYQRAKKTPTVLILLTLLIAAAIFFLSPNHMKGLRHLGITLLIVGLAMLLFSWGLNKGVTTKVVPNLTIKDNSILTDKVRTLVTDIAQRVDKNYWAFGGIYTALGASALGAPILMRRRQTKVAKANAPAEAPILDTPEELQKPVSKPKPKKNIKIQ